MTKRNSRCSARRETIDFPSRSWGSSKLIPTPGVHRAFECTTMAGPDPTRREEERKLDHHSAKIVAAKEVRAGAWTRMALSNSPASHQ